MLKYGYIHPPPITLLVASNTIPNFVSFSLFDDPQSPANAVHM